MTYSIVAFDPATGELGVAVQSRWFSVGSGVPWVEPGVGAVATQSFTEAAHGPNGLRLMREGRTAAEALAAGPGVRSGRGRAPGGHGRRRAATRPRTPGRAASATPRISSATASPCRRT